jgi:hypothetical protein
MPWDLGSIVQIVISLITLYLLIWFNKVGRVEDREELLRRRLRGMGQLSFITKLGEFTPSFVQMSEPRGFGYRLKKLLLWRVDGYTKVLLCSYGARLATDEQLSRFKEVAKRELDVEVSFSRQGDIVAMTVEIRSVDPDRCIKILEELGRLEV